MKCFVKTFVHYLKQNERKTIKFRYSRWALTDARKRKASELCPTYTSVAVFGTATAGGGKNFQVGRWMAYTHCSPGRFSRRI